MFVGHDLDFVSPPSDGDFKKKEKKHNRVRHRGEESSKQVQVAGGHKFWDN